MNLEAYERETIINYNEEEKTASIYTYDKQLIKRLSEYCRKHPELFKQEQAEFNAMNFTIPKRYVSIRAPKEYTEEQRQEMRERGQRLRQQQEQNKTNIA